MRTLSLVRVNTPQFGGAIDMRMAHSNTEVLSLFTEWMKTRGMSPATIKRRRSSLSAFARWVAPLRITDADGDHVETWLSTFTNARTRHAYRSDLSAFYQWGVKRKVVRSNPVNDTDSIRVPKSLPRLVPIEAVPHIIAACDNGRLRMALMLAAYAGLRRSEICRLDAADIRLHPSRPTLTVRSGKGNKDRVVPLHPRLVRSLLARRPQGRLIPWSPDTLGRLAAEHMRRMGYDCTIHQLRASYATELARVTHGDIVTVGKVLGHESPATTMIYVDYADEKIGEHVAEIYRSA